MASLCRLSVLQYCYKEKTVAVDGVSLLKWRAPFSLSKLVLLREREKKREVRYFNLMKIHATTCIIIVCQIIATCILMSAYKNGKGHILIFETNMLNFLIFELAPLLSLARIASCCVK